MQFKKYRELNRVKKLSTIDENFVFMKHLSKSLLGTLVKHLFLRHSKILHIIVAVCLSSKMPHQLDTVPKLELRAVIQFHVKCAFQTDNTCCKSSIRNNQFDIDHCCST